ncbi:MAG: hypothetical protein ACI9IA_001419, partial [Enterobacterales bacterium]
QSNSMFRRCSIVPTWLPTVDANRCESIKE